LNNTAPFVKEYRLPYNLSAVLVVVPAFNEEAAIADVVLNARQAGFNDVLVIDDGSPDRTATKAHQAGAHVLHLPYNLGIGGAVQAGLRFAVEMGYSYVIRLDGDGQHRMEEASKLLRVVQSDEADVAIGSRFLPGQHTYTPPFSRAMGIRWFAAMVSSITRKPAYDTTSGMQALNRQAMIILAQNYPQDYPEVEARILMHKTNLRVKEISARMEPRATGMSSITYLRAIYYLFKVSLATLIAALRQTPRQYLREI
jgi:glycosyltransferase involved in cell wall biosynthesis